MLATLIASAFGLWKYCLNPLKERVIITEKYVVIVKTEMGSIKTDVHSIKDDMQLLKTHLLKA